jgi:drug/metabolite transporter (DMT)-like permease
MLYATPLILVPALMYWTTPTLSQGALMVGVGLLATLNQRFMSRAFAAADATAMFPFEFIRLPFAALIGWLAFSELPDIWVWIGGAVIFASSAYIAHREAQVKRLQK